MDTLKVCEFTNHPTLEPSNIELHVDRDHMGYRYVFVENLDVWGLVELRVNVLGVEYSNLGEPYRSTAIVRTDATHPRLKEFLVSRADGEVLNGVQAREHKG